MSFLSGLAPIIGMGAGTLVGGPVGGALGGAAGGALAGNQKEKRAKQIEDQSRFLASETARYSPWTGMTPNQIQWAGADGADTGAGALSGGLTGLSFGQSLAPKAPAAAAPAALGSNQSPWMNMQAGGYDQAPNLYSNSFSYSKVPTMKA